MTQARTTQLLFTILILLSVEHVIHAIPFKKDYPLRTAGHPKIADVNGDGVNDLIVHVHIDALHIKDPSREPGLYALLWPSLEAITLFRGPVTGERFAVADINGDGYVDALSGRVIEGDTLGAAWYENPGPAGVAAGEVWKEHLLGEHPSHVKDILGGDLDGDGRMDIVVRGLSRSSLFLQTAEGWKHRVFHHPRREGLALGDLDLDGDLDLVLNGYWIEMPPDPLNDPLQQHPIDPLWFTQNTGSWQDNACYTAVGDLNGDGLLDVILSHSEHVGYPLAWYAVERLEQVKTGPWRKQLIEREIPWCETLDVADVDNDGDLDLLAASFARHPSPEGLWENTPPYPVRLYLNEDQGTRWRVQTLSDAGIYAGALGDLGSDGDIDVTGPYSYFRGPVYLWENKLADEPPSLAQWTYHEIDAARGKFGDHGTPEWLKYFGLATCDVNHDGKRDIVSGRYFYLNPGANLEGTWERHTFSLGVDACLSLDVDLDHRADVIAMALPEVYWLEAEDPSGNSWRATVIGQLPPTDHTNSQGFITGQIIPGGREEILFNTDEGCFAFVVPDDPEKTPWERLHLTQHTSQEGLALANIDRDGFPDLISAKNNEHVAWWKNPGDGSEGWTQFTVGATRHAADRVAAADLNGDGRIDIVVTEERWPGKDPDASLYWFEQPGDPQATNWKRHTLLTTYSLNNLAVADLDRDGDADILTAEHKGTALRTLLFRNDGKGQFAEQTLDTGKESHLGLLLDDLDGDGDLDLLSIGWDHYSYLHLWRNDAR